MIDKKLIPKIISLVVLVAFIVVVWNMLDLVLLTFIFTFVFNAIFKLYERKIAWYLPIKLPYPLVITIIFLIGIGLLVFAGIKFAPPLFEQTIDLANQLARFDFNSLKDQLLEHAPKLMADSINNIDISSYFKDIANSLTSLIGQVATFSINFFFAVVLSYMMLVERKVIKKFGASLEESQLSDIYKYFIRFGKNFCVTFSVVMRVQVTIALINSIISSIALAFMGFPNIFGLGIMIFCLGLIPVAGVIISLIPLCLIAFTIGGIGKVVAVVIMIIVVHTIEAYILNPKLMSHRTELPVCLVFIILIVAEHYLGVWGLLIGVPIFVFIITVSGVKPK